jgi:hypothetical protein
VALMAIVKSTAFQGSPIQDVDVDVETWARVTKNAQGDIAGTLDDLTSTSAANPIDHSGPGNGALLGIPWVNQFCDLVVDFDATTNKNGGVGNAASGGTVQFPWFVRVEPGETEVRIEVTIQSSRGRAFSIGHLPRVRLCSSSNFTTAAGSELEIPLDIETEDGTSLTLTATHTGVTAPGLYLAIVQMESLNVIDGTSLSCGLVDVVIRKPRNGRAVVDAPRNDGNPVPVVAPGASLALFHQPMDESLFSSGDGLTGWHTTRIDRNANGLAEYLTGAPAGTNEDYTHTESVLENPTRDRFHSPNRKTFANKPIPIIPVVSHCHGGIKSEGGYLVDPSTPASVNARKAFAPYPTSSTLANFGGITCRVPDVPSTTLNFAILLGQSNLIGFADVRTAAFMASSSALTAPVALTGAAHLALHTGTVSFVSDDVDSLFTRMQQAAGVFNSLNYCLLSTCLWVEP